MEQKLLQKIYDQLLMITVVLCIMLGDMIGYALSHP